MPFRCLKIDFISQRICANFSFATDYHYYQYTSYENLSNFDIILQQIEPIIIADLQHFCSQFFTYYFCNYIFPPCDLTTGAPQAICSESCEYFVAECDEHDHLPVFIELQGYDLNIDCRNTLAFQQGYGFPCSSSSLQNNCIDILGMFIC